MLSVLSVDPVSTVGWVSAPVSVVHGAWPETITTVVPRLTVVPGGGSVVTNWQAVKLDSSRGSTSRLTHSSPPHVALMASSSLCLTSSRGRPWAWVILGIWIGAPSASPPPPRPTGDPAATPPGRASPAARVATTATGEQEAHHECVRQTAQCCHRDLPPQLGRRVSTSLYLEHRVVRVIRQPSDLRVPQQD